MNASTLPVTPKHRTFTSPESFGLFMEALRDLQTYTEESEQSAPNAAGLEEHLDSALEALLHCHQGFPGDLLPRYYLGIALTMKNQHLYAKSILEEISKGTSADGSTSTSVVSETILNAVFAPRPWPLLDRAINLFGQVIHDGYSVLEQAAKFNLAHVYAKRDGRGDLEKSLEFLVEIPTRSRPARPLTSYLGPWGFVAKFLQKRYAADERAYREAVALAFQARTLTSAVRARQAIQSDNEASYSTCLEVLEALRGEINQTTDLDPEPKHDLMADSCTKSGFVILLHAIAHNKEASELKVAEESLDRALDYKPFWIPAQTYLGLVYVAQARLDDAKKELASVIGAIAN